MARAPLSGPSPVALTFPPQADTREKRVAYLWRTAERLRLAHNDLARGRSAKEMREYRRTILRPKRYNVHAALNGLRDQSALNPDQEARNAAALAVKLAGKAAKDWDALIDLDALSLARPAAPPIDPYENLTTYTKFDPLGILTLTADRVTFNGNMNSGTSAPLLSRDCEAGHFAGSYEHMLTLSRGATDNGYYAIWALLNTVERVYAMQIAKRPGLLVYLYRSAGIWRTQLYESVSGNTLYSDYYQYGAAQDQYLNFIRTQGTPSVLDLEIYSDFARLTLVDTPTLNLHDDTAFRYALPFAAYGATTPTPVSVGHGEKHDLGEGGIVPQATNNYRRRRVA